VVAWAKPDPTRCEEPVPKAVASEEPFVDHDRVFERYGEVMYLIVALTKDRRAAQQALAAILDLLFSERGFEPRAANKVESAEMQRQWLDCMLPKLEETDILHALKSHRFVVLQGPPGTGKTRAMIRIAQSHFQGQSTVVQLHPNTTYETFIGGLAPQVSEKAQSLTFAPKAGVLLRAISAAQADPSTPYLLALDEINRADLAKVMGEAIYLLEPHPEVQRRIELEHRFPELGASEVTMPDNLHILGTMNTADRSIAIVDVAVRRRFAFLNLWPRVDVVEDQSSSLAKEAFQKLLSIYVDFAGDDAFTMIPGHSYFLGASDEIVKLKLRDSLLPLLNEYLTQGYASGFAGELRAYCQWLADRVV
jgi:5-methylcytosine-specific restriction protein B